MTDIADLIVKAQNGDKRAFHDIYITYYERIYRYLIFNSQTEEGAKDICQETFLKAWKALPRFTIEKQGTLQAFLFKIARNLLIDQSRKKKVYPLHEHIEIEIEEDHIEQFASEQKEKQLQAALQKLEETDRQIIILRYFEELSTAETAKALSMKEGALRVRIHRTLKKLEGFLQRYAD